MAKLLPFTEVLGSEPDKDGVRFRQIVAANVEDLFRQHHHGSAFRRFIGE